MNKKRSIGTKLLLLIASTLISCLLLELGVRLTLGKRIILYPRFHAKAEYGPYTIRRLRPNANFMHRSIDGSWKFTVNSSGFRAFNEYSYTKPKGCLRVISVGDSHTQGFECRQDMTYSAVMQRYLDQHCGPAEVINAGVSGFSTAEALVFIENEGLRYQPDVVVLGFFANDLDDNTNADLFRLEGETLVSHGFHHIPAVGVLDVIDKLPPLRWLSQNSYAYSYLFNSVWEYKKRQLAKMTGREMAIEYAFKQEDSNPELANLKLRLAGALIQRLHAACRSNGVALVVLDIPQHGKGDEAFKSSIPAQLVPRITAHSDLLILSSNVLEDYAGVADFFVPNGQGHISETTHMLLGVAAGKAIKTLTHTSRPAAP